MSNENFDMLNLKLDTVIDTLKDHETRLRRIERWLWAVSGIAVASGIGGASQLQQLIGG